VLEKALQLFVNGLMAGSILMVPAIGFTAMFAVLRFPNFALAAHMTIGAFAGFVANTVLGLPAIASLAAAFLVAGLVGVASDVVVLRPLRPSGALTVAIVHQVPILPLAMGGVERVVADHGQGLLGEVVLDHVIEILVMAPGKIHIGKAAAFRINTQPRLVGGHLAIWIGVEEFRKDDLVRPRAAHREGWCGAPLPRFRQCGRRDAAPGT